MPEILLSTLNAKYIHSAFGLRYLLANMGDLSGRTAIQEFDINQRPLDIAEAVLADGLHGFSKNARAGLELDLHPATKVWVSGDNRSVNFNLSQDWDSLYESWNMAFIAGNRPNHQLLFPKLLIPQVIDAKPEEYIYNRALALWLTENFQLFNRIEKKAPVVIPGGAEMAKRWGEINLAYGRHLGEMHGTGG